MTNVDERGVATWHQSFARCPECSHATVGLSRPWAINHAPGCSAPTPPIRRCDHCGCPEDEHDPPKWRCPVPVYLSFKAEAP